MSERAAVELRVCEMGRRLRRPVSQGRTHGHSEIEGGERKTDLSAPSAKSADFGRDDDADVSVALPDRRVDACEDQLDRLGQISLLLMTGTGKHLRRIRWWIAVMVAGLLLSGVTAFPLQVEVAWLHRMLASSALAEHVGLLAWIARVDAGLTATYAAYPFVAYGTDWLAFAHVAIAAAFLGPWMDPVRNKWVFMWGLLACAGVIPLALIAGPVRGIPLGWRMVDCSFGVVGCVPMLMCLREVRRLSQGN